MAVDISPDHKNLRIHDIHTMLSKVFWSPDITREEILKGIRNSALVVGAYGEGSRQIGFLRVVSDKIRCAYLMDVVVHEDFRRQGIGQTMVRFALSHPELKDVYQWLLVTKDAHGVYEKCGFRLLQNPERWMSIMVPRPDRSHYGGLPSHASPAQVAARSDDACRQTPMNVAHRIVPARMEDAAEIARLSTELGYPTTVEQTRTALGCLLESPRHFVAVAGAEGGTLLGWIAAERRLSLESAETAEITGLVVAAPARRSGIGSALAASAEQWALGEGFACIRVRSNVMRTDSHPFYQGIGFRPTKTQHVYEKSLRPPAPADAGRHPHREGHNG